MPYYYRLERNLNKIIIFPRKLVFFVQFIFSIIFIIFLIFSTFFLFFLFLLFLSFFFSLFFFFFLLFQLVLNLFLLFIPQTFNLIGDVFGFQLYISLKFPSIIQIDGLFNGLSCQQGGQGHITGRNQVIISIFIEISQLNDKGVSLQFVSGKNELILPFWVYSLSHSCGGYHFITTQGYLHQRIHFSER